MKIAGRDMKPLDLVFILLGVVLVIVGRLLDKDTEELITPYTFIHMTGFMMIIYGWLGPWWKKGNMVKEPDDDVKLAGWDRDSISEYWAKISFGKKALLAITVLLIGGAISNWVDVTNISNGMRIFLVIVIVSLMIWYFKGRD